MVQVRPQWIKRGELGDETPRASRRMTCEPAAILASSHHVRLALRLELAQNIAKCSIPQVRIATWRDPLLVARTPVRSALGLCGVPRSRDALTSVLRAPSILHTDLRNAGQGLLSSRETPLLRIAVNALSVTNMSGRHVLLGHLMQLVEQTSGAHDFVVLFHGQNADIQSDLGPHVDWVECPAHTAHWLRRSLWERSALPALLRDLAADLLFSPAGIAAPAATVPQVVFAQNPWCLVGGIRRTLAEQGKALLQRRAYRHAMRVARMMVFNSRFMQQAYRANAGFDEPCSEIVYQAVDEETHATAAKLRPSVQRHPHRVLSVSVMTPHKDVETVVRALDRVRRRHGIAAELALVGPWADPAYEQRIRRLVADLGLESAVCITGRVPREALHRHYAEARVFCLMSRCESFGIPAVEAQTFGTPVVSSNGCAIPEICGQGGLYPEIGDAEGTAAALARLLSDDGAWAEMSQRARENAERFHWRLCSKPLLRMFEIAGERGG